MQTCRQPAARCAGARSWRDSAATPLLRWPFPVETLPAHSTSPRHSHLLLLRPCHLRCKSIVLFFCTMLSCKTSLGWYNVLVQDIIGLVQCSRVQCRLLFRSLTVFEGRDEFVFRLKNSSSLLLVVVQLLLGRVTTRLRRLRLRCELYRSRCDVTNKNTLTKQDN